MKIWRYDNNQSGVKDFEFAWKEGEAFNDALVDAGFDPDERVKLGHAADGNIVAVYAHYDGRLFLFEICFNSSNFDLVVIDGYINMLHFLKTLSPIATGLAVVNALEDLTLAIENSFPGGGGQGGGRR